MEFVKLHALGNDFIVLCRGLEPGFAVPGEAARRICDRHTGVGADGVIILSPTEGRGGEFDFRVINADGSEAEMSGNGLRCAVACLVFEGTVTDGRAVFHTAAGERRCEVIARRGTEVEIRSVMGTPRLTAADIPFDDGRPHDRVVDYPIPVEGGTRAVTCVSMGNPHCSLFVDSFPPRPEWHKLGAALETHRFFPARTNVEFIRVVNRGEVEVLFWERGVGETLASGTGSCAAAVASMLKNLTDRRVNVKTALGSLVVEWLPDGQVLQTGPAKVVFTGEYPAR